MRLLYATSTTYPSPLANRVQILEMAKAFRELLGDDFLLGIGRNKGEPFPLPVVEVGANVRSYKLAWKYLQIAREKEITHIFCREEKLLFFMWLYKLIMPRRFPEKLAFEIHHLDHEREVWFQILIQHIPHIVSITNGTKEMLAARGIPPERISVEPDAVNAEEFDIPDTKLEVRSKLGLPLDKTIVMYTGALDPWKGVNVLYHAAELLPERFQVVTVGARQSHVIEFNQLYPPRPNFTTIGHVAHSQIPLYMRAADVMVIPNSGKTDISRHHTSPMKLFEYMAAKKPIVASDLPSIREIADETKAYMFEPDNAESLAEAIVKAAEDEAGAHQRVQVARSFVERFTWIGRARRIISFMS